MLPFTVADVPASDFYQVEVSHRGAVTFSQADLVKQAWSVELSLG
ncbi:MULTISPECIES: hypothetical protein [Kineosporia]|nr:MULTISPECIES: hypothetical protein [Kineosporia]